MKFIGKLKDKEITFHLLSSENEIIENLSFVHLVKMKFGGDEVNCSSVHAEGNDEYIVVTISFPDWSATDNAKAHCNQNIGQDGNVISSYKGALLRADPSHVIAQSIMKRALSNKRSS